MSENKQQLLNDLHQSVMRYRRMKEETSDPIAARFLRDIVVDLETEIASLKVETGHGQA
jgi:hypothetical protein